MTGQWRPRLVWTGFGYAYDEATYERFTTWRDEQVNLPDDENEQMDLWEEYMAEGAEEYGERQAEQRKEDRGW
jgi:hypothetical protein